MVHNRKAHYLPQFYLRHFAASEKEGHVWAYRDFAREWKLCGVNTVAWQPHLYAREGKGGQRDNAMEAYLQQVESRAAPLLAKLARTDCTPDDDERAVLSLFVGLLMMRVPAWFNFAEVVIADNARALCEANYARFRADPQQLEQFKQFYRTVTGRSTPDDLTVGEMDPARLVCPPPRHSVVVCSFRTAEVLGPHIANMDWALFRCAPNECFVTSDNPVCVLNTDDGTVDLAGGVMRPAAELTCPLAPNVMLCAAGAGKRCGWFSAASSAVAELNQRSVHHAASLIVSGGTEFPGRTDVLARFNELAAGSRNPGRNSRMHESGAHHR